MIFYNRGITKNQRLFLEIHRVDNGTTHFELLPRQKILKLEPSFVYESLNWLISTKTLRAKKVLSKSEFSFYETKNILDETAIFIGASRSHHVWRLGISCDRAD